MIDRNQNTFFTRKIYDNDIELEINKEVLERIHDDGITPNDKLPIEFAFLTDMETKAIVFKRHLSDNFPYINLKIKDYEENYEISGVTEPIRMDLTTINAWNQLMWDIGYEFDCKLDGWQVGV